MKKNPYEIDDITHVKHGNFSVT